MSEIQIGLRSVLGHIYFAVLIRAHRSGIYVDIGVELLRRHLQSPCLEQASQRCRRDALSETRNNAAGYKNVLGHGLILRYL